LFDDQPPAPPSEVVGSEPEVRGDPVAASEAETAPSEAEIRASETASAVTEAEAPASETASAVTEAEAPASETASSVSQADTPASGAETAAGVAETVAGVGDTGADEAGQPAVVAVAPDGDPAGGEGALLDVTVLRVDAEVVVVGIGDGAEALIPARELTVQRDVDPTTVVAAGDTFAAVVVGKDDESGRLVLSKKRADHERVWSRIEQLKDGQEPVRGTVVEVVKGGLILDIGLRGFLPASQVEMRRVRDLRPYLGRELDVRVIEMDRGRGNVVLSRRAFLEQTKTQSRADVLRALQKGQIRRGVVSSIVNFGAFVDLGGVDGLVHVSELSWKHVNHPSEVVQVGQEIAVEVIEVDQSRERVSLSHRSTLEDPWHVFAREHAIGQIIPGTVTKLVPFGAFVRLDDGIEGLVHISELADRHVEQAEQAVRAGQHVFVKVLDIDLRRRRISLSVKQADAAYVDDPDYFDPAVYGMAATYDAEGNYIYPEGFDSETGEWIEGFEAQRDVWERQYEVARERWEAHGRQVRAAGEQPEAEEPPPLPTGEELPVDQALAALRERLGAERKE
jgi:small subunit ribosomal protein S1